MARELLSETETIRLELCQEGEVEMRTRLALSARVS